MKKHITAFALLILLISCGALTGEEIARLQINKLSTNGNIIAKDVTLDLKKGEEIAFWSDMDMEYQGDLQLQFKVKLFKDKTLVNSFEFDPREKNITIGEVKTQLNEKTKWRFSGKNYALTIDEDASYRISSILVASENPVIKIAKAELVIKK